MARLVRANRRTQITILYIFGENTINSKLIWLTYVVEVEIYRRIVHLINLQKSCYAIISTWTRISKECFQHLAASTP